MGTFKKQITKKWEHEISWGNWNLEGNWRTEKWEQ